MAYNLVNRFPQDPKYYRIFEPGAYQYEDGGKYKPNKVPFLSGTPRIIQFGGKAYTHSIYDTDIPPKIPNCTSILSRIPRFPYAALSKEDLEDILCKCGIDTKCECADENEQEVVVCQGKVPKRIFIGPTSRGHGPSDASAPCKGEQGFSDGTQNKIKSQGESSPPFYNTRVHEQTAFYQGCKWSTWTGSRASKPLEQRPGPADYIMERQPTQYEICAERLRAYKRKTSKQYRYIEMVQRRNVLESAPGPATYSPTFPKSTKIDVMGPKTERFPPPTKLVPGPADYKIRRDFDLPDPPDKPCHATFPEPACFGVKDKRFKPQIEKGPSPASYNTNHKLCQFMKCSMAPFGAYSERFKQDVMEESDDDSQDECYEEEPKEPCPTYTWEFKSRTVRLKPLKKQLNAPSPADVPQGSLKMKRPVRLQYYAPFFSSEGRFRRWYNWVPVHGNLVTPAPYSAMKPKCQPAVNRGPLVRCRRFHPPTFLTPAPNAYYVSGGIEAVLSTYNKRLQDNVNNQHTFKWELPVEERKLSYDEKKHLLIKKCIDLCDVEPKDKDKKEIKSEQDEMNNNLKKKPKLLRYFLHNHEIQPCP